jgi:hypothetical protein
MKRFVVAFLVCCMIMTSLVAVATAADGPQKFAVLPFAINGPEKYDYLSKGISDMLATRLSWRDHFESVDKELVRDKGTAPTSRMEVIDQLDTLGADYLVWGAAMIAGENVSLDVKVEDKKGRSWPNSSTVKIHNLIPELEKMAGRINEEIFARPNAAGDKKEKKQVKVLNPGLVYNESVAGQEFTLNPQFRYEGGSKTPGRWQSQALPFAAGSMVVCDGDGDGKTEIFLLEDHVLHAFSIDNRRLVPLAEYKFPRRYQMVRLNSFDFDRDGCDELFVTGLSDRITTGINEDARDVEPISFIFRYKDKQFVMEREKIPYYINKVRLPPNYRPLLVGQKVGKTNMFDKHVYELIVLQNEVKLGKRLKLPPFSNVFNFAYLPAKEGMLTIFADSEDNLRVYDSRDEVLYQSERSYANSPVGVEVFVKIPGLGLKRDNPVTDLFYFPERLLLVQLSGDRDKYELLVNRNRSVAGQFFERYRNYPFGEMHSLFWDGVGLSLAWKTREIKGTIIDYCTADIDSDGEDELCVCINSYAGGVGLEHRRTRILAYELDLDDAAE